MPSSIAAAIEVEPRPLSQWPFGGEWTTRIEAPPRSPSFAAASSSLRSKLQSHGVVGTPAPRPKKTLPSILALPPCRTVAAGHPSHAARSASSVSLLPGTSTVGISISRSQPTVSSRPSVDRREVAGDDHHVGVAAALDQRPAGTARSQCRSLTASSFGSAAARSSSLDSQHRPTSSSSIRSFLIWAAADLQATDREHPDRHRADRQRADGQGSGSAPSAPTARCGHRAGFRPPATTAARRSSHGSIGFCLMSEHSALTDAEPPTDRSSGAADSAAPTARARPPSTR